MPILTSCRFCPVLPEPSVDKLICDFMRESRLRRPEPVATTPRILDGMDFECCLPTERDGRVAFGSDGSLLAVVWDGSVSTRDIYNVTADGVTCISKSVPEVTALAIHTGDDTAYAWCDHGRASLWSSRFGTVQIPRSAGLEAVAMHFVDRDMLAAVLVGESDMPELPVRSIATIALGECHRKSVLEVDLISRRSAMAWGCEMLAIGDIHGTVHLFDVAGQPGAARRIRAPGVGPISSVAFDQEARAVYLAQGTKLYRYYLESRGEAIKLLWSAAGPIRFLQGSVQSVVALVTYCAERLACPREPPYVIGIKGKLGQLSTQVGIQVGTESAPVVGVVGCGRHVTITRLNMERQIFELVWFQL